MVCCDDPLQAPLLDRQRDRKKPTFRRLLERVDERSFDVLYRGALTLVALRLVLWDGWKLLTAA